MTETAAPYVVPQYVSSYDPDFSVGTDVYNILPTITGVVWTNANRAYFVPLHLPGPALVARLWLANGGTVSGNVDLGIYAMEAGTSASLIVSGGGTAQSGLSTMQFMNVTDVTLPAGSYYLAISKSDTSTGAVRSFLPATFPLRMNLFGLATMESAYPLPATATLVQAATGTLPLIGFSSRAGP